MKVLWFLLIMISLQANGNDQFLEYIQDKKVSMAFDNGEIHTLTFSKNRFGIITGSYTDELGNKVVGMPVKFVEEEGQEFLRLFKDRKSPVGTYKYAFYVYIPVLFTPGVTKAFVDARWGSFQEVLFFIENKRI